MATLKPLVIKNGQIQQIQAGDDISVAVSPVGIISKTNSDASILKGAPVYRYTDGSIRLASASAIGTAKVVGLVYDANIANNAVGNIQVDGILTATLLQWNEVLEGEGAFTGGTYYYLSDTAGLITATPPDTIGHCVVEIGYSLSNTEMLLSTSFRPVLL